MSKNLNQVYIDNPTSQLPGVNGQPGDALIYLAIDPYGVGNDSGILSSDFASSFMVPINNLSDVDTVGTARQNLQVPGTASGTGDPTGLVAGVEGDFYIDLVTSDLWVCTSTGDALNAVWALVSSSGFASLPYNDVAATTQAAAINNGYIISNALQTTVTLPATAAEGSVVAIQGKGAAGWILTANSGQVIHLGSSVTSTAGTLTSTNQYDAVEVVCVIANTDWAVKSVIGNLTVA